MARPAVVLIAIFVVSLAGMTLSSSMASAQIAPSPGNASSSGASPCEENWTCSGWGSCALGVSSRLCTDISGCGTVADKPLENQSCMTATGIVNLTILKAPEICGDARCSRNETCETCPEDCGGCGLASGLAGLVTGAVELSLSGLVVVIAIAALLLAMVFMTRKGKK